MNYNQIPTKTTGSKQYNTLKQQFIELSARLHALPIKPEQWFAKNDLFNSTAFYTRSDELKDYILELDKNITKLDSISDVQMMEHFASRIADQFSCFRGLLNSVELNAKSKHYNTKQVQRLKKVKQFAQKATKSSQALYQELSELQEFERRLLDMVSDKQQALARYSGQVQRQSLQEQVLFTQQRLGRCRKAISNVEEQIQKLDERPF